MDIDKGAHYVLERWRDALFVKIGTPLLTHIRMNWVKDENKFTRHFKAVIPEGYISISVNFINLAVLP